ncbi:LysR substrate-binding domain-containing protein [Candidatus Pyrohabitans sp.]
MEISRSNLTLEHLYTLLVVAKKKSFLDAARELGIVQSTVSMRIAALEKAFGAKLFKRTLYGVTLTEEGVMVLNAIKSALGTLEDAGKRVKKGVKEEKSAVSIATCFTGGIYVLPPILDAFEKAHGFRPELVITDTGRVINKLRRGEVNFVCFGSRGYANRYVREKCVFMPIGWDELVLVVPKYHELAERAEVALKEIRSYPFIMPMKHSEAYGEITAMSPKIKKLMNKLNVVTELESTETILTAISRNVGISILPSLPVEEAQKCMPLSSVKISGLNAKRTFYLGCPKGENEKDEVKPFWEFVKSYRQIKSAPLQRV